MKATEKCACGSEVQVDAEPRHVTDALTEWRDNHACDRRPGPQGTDSLVERAHPDDVSRHAELDSRLGFRPNPTEGDSSV